MPAGVIGFLTYTARTSTSWRNESYGPAEEEKEPELPEDVKLLMEIRDLLKK